MQGGSKGPRSNRGQQGGVPAQNHGVWHCKGTLHVHAGMACARDFQVILIKGGGASVCATAQVFLRMSQLDKQPAPRGSPTLKHIRTTWDTQLHPLSGQHPDQRQAPLGVVSRQHF